MVMMLANCLLLSLTVVEALELSNTHIPMTNRRSLLKIAMPGTMVLLPFPRPQQSSAMWQLWFPSDMLNYVKRYAEEGSPSSVLEAMDKAAETSWMMNMGAEKGEVLENLLLKRYSSRANEVLPPATKVLELGTFCGYSTIRIARSLPSRAVVVTIEKDPETYKVAREIIGRAGLLPEVEEYKHYSRAGKHATVEMYLGSSSEIIPNLRSKYDDGFDFVLMDHWKELYDVDLKALEDNKLVRVNSAVLADNVKLPGAPRFLEYLYYGKGYFTWDTSIIDIPFEYRPETPDAMTYSVFRTGKRRADPIVSPREPCSPVASNSIENRVDRLICEALMNSPNDGRGSATGG